MLNKAVLLTSKTSREKVLLGRFNGIIYNGGWELRNVIDQGSAVLIQLKESDGYGVASLIMTSLRPSITIVNETTGLEVAAQLISSDESSAEYVYFYLLTSGLQDGQECVISIYG